MIWLWIALLALAVLLIGLFVLRIPRNAVTALAAAIAVGLAGYSWQGEPTKPSAMPQTSGIEEDLGEQIVTLRRQILPEDEWSNNGDAMLTADAFARRGRFQGASVAYGTIVRKDPLDSEAWLALGNVLVGHADGIITPPAVRAYRAAEELDPDTPGVPFFFGLALIQNGDFMQARGAWAEALSRTPEGSEAHTLLTERLGRLDNLISIASGGRMPTGSPAQSAPHSEATPAENAPEAN